MFKKNDKGAAKPPDVWIIGNAHPNADRSLDWDDPFPNLSDPDVLIVDLTTLTNKVLERLDKQKLVVAQRSIRDKFIKNGTVIIITRPYFSIVQNNCTYSNYSILPARLSTINVTPGNKIKPDDGHSFRAYIDDIKSFSFQIEGWGPKATPPRPDSRPVLTPVLGQGIEDNAGHRLGLTLTLERLNNTGGRPQVLDAGHLVFLPPPTGSMSDALGKILAVFGKVYLLNEVLPDWAERLQIRLVADLESQISELKNEVSQRKKKIDELTEKKNRVLRHRRLLCLKGMGLEEAVADAFKVLGFNDIRKMRGPDREDWIIDIKSNDYLYGVIEVKGADARTKQGDIVQCSKWVDERFSLDGKASKGVFVPNQHREVDYLKSCELRAKFEPNELKYAKIKDICIIPSYVLFEAVEKTLEGNKPSRKMIVEKITGTRGVLHDML